MLVHRHLVAFGFLHLNNVVVAIAIDVLVVGIDARKGRSIVCDETQLLGATGDNPPLLRQHVLGVEGPEPGPICVEKGVRFISLLTPHEINNRRKTG